ncbi:MAG: hypothetical protein JW784_06890 [Candidatus Cloacimonetes bacterium]|nr:hypothetical protein [Candidatus Cloacimonadota bacterium]
MMILLLAGCASTGNSAYKPQDSILNYEALHYYSMAETAIQMRDLHSAVDLLKIAANKAPDSIQIRERLLEVMNQQAQTKPEIREEIILLGEEYYRKQLYSPDILLYLAESYNYRKEYDRAGFFLQLALEQRPTMHLYASYHLFLRKNQGETRRDLLEKALDLPWQNQEDVLFVADLFRAIDPEQTASIMEKAYDTWNDERTLRLLLTAYENLGKQGKINEAIQNRLDQKLETSDFLKIHLISNYFQEREFQKVVDNSKICLEINRDPLLRYLFFSAFSLNLEELALNAGKTALSVGDLPEELLSSFHAYYAFALLKTGDDDQAAFHFAAADNLEISTQLLTEYGVLSGMEDERIENFLTLIREKSSTDDFGNFITAYIYTLLDRKLQGATFMDKVNREYLKKNDQLLFAAISYLNNQNNVEEASKLLDLRDNRSPSIQEVLGFYYYNIEADSLAFNYFLSELNSNPQPTAGIFIVISILGERLGKIEELVKILDKAVTLYPDNAEILNILGYTIADHNLRDRFEQGEKLLLKAVELEPDNAMFWDSLAWLNFRLNRFEQALAAMQKPLEAGIEHSEIAYHLGEIYLKLNKITEARKYLNLAIDLDTEPASVQNASELLESLNKR